MSDLVAVSVRHPVCFNFKHIDCDCFKQLSNEFHFPIAAIHHASEAYLVPEILNRTYGGSIDHYILCDRLVI